MIAAPVLKPVIRRFADVAQGGLPAGKKSPKGQNRATRYGKSHTQD
jgi:hypothetical protein